MITTPHMETEPSFLMCYTDDRKKGRKKIEGGLKLKTDGRHFLLRE